MSNRSPKRSLLTERKVRSVIREEINTRYGNNLTARQKAMLEEGILQGVKNALGGIFGVGSAGGKYIASKVGGIGANIAKAADGIKTAYASGQLDAAKKAFNDLATKTNAAGEQLVAMFIKAKVTVPSELKEFETPNAKKEAEAIPAAPAAATPAAPAAPAAATPAAAPAAAPPAAAMEESLRRKYRLGLISLNEYNMKRRR